MQCLLTGYIHFVRNKCDFYYFIAWHTLPHYKCFFRRPLAPVIEIVAQKLQLRCRYVYLVIFCNRFSAYIIKFYCREWEQFEEFLNVCIVCKGSLMQLVVVNAAVHTTPRIAI